MDLLRQVTKTCLQFSSRPSTQWEKSTPTVIRFQEIIYTSTLPGTQQRHGRKSHSQVPFGHLPGLQPRCCLTCNRLKLQTNRPNPDMFSDELQPDFQAYR